MQRAPIYARQQMYVDLVKYFKNFGDHEIKKTINPSKGEGLIFVINASIGHCSNWVYTIYSGRYGCGRKGIFYKQSLVYFFRFKVEEK